MNILRKKGMLHSSAAAVPTPLSKLTTHTVAVADALDVLRKIPDNSIQLVICDPPYNINVASWDDMVHYVDWAGKWIREVERVLSDSGNFVLFGGLQYQGEAGSGDLLSLISWMKCCSRILLFGIIRTEWARNDFLQTDTKKLRGSPKLRSTISI
jgi:site-specific DNA-methyltransferase (adenine-specific)